MSLILELTFLQKYKLKILIKVSIGQYTLEVNCFIREVSNLFLVSESW